MLCKKSMTKEQTRKYNSFYQIITTVNTTPEQKYELLESFVDAIIKEEISQEKEKMIDKIKELRSKEIDMIALKQTGMQGQGKIDAFKEVLDLLETK